MVTVAISDSELEAIRRSKLRELRTRSVAKQAKAERINVDKVLNKIFMGRAWEVFNTASYQFPDVMQKLKPILVDLASLGKLREVTGEQLFLFLKKLGFRVKLNTRISYTEDGKLKSFADKIRDDLRRT